MGPAAGFLARAPRIKLAITVALVAAAVIGRPPWSIWLTAVLLLFGAFNVVFVAPGTEWVRALAIGATFSALLFPSFAGPFVFFGSLMWPPAFAIAWAAGRDPRHDRREAMRARIALATLIVAVALGSIAYRALVAHNLQQTAALFIGIPALLAIVVVFGPSPSSATGVACKAVTIGLLVSMLFLWEGLVCVLMSAPLFYAVALGVARAMEAANEKGTIRLRSCLILLAIVPMSLEGVTQYTTVRREESVSVSQIVGAPAQAVERALREAPRFDRVRPLYLRAGFPTPVSTRIERHSGELHWIIQMRGGEMLLSGMEPGAGDLTLRLEEQEPGFMRWSAASDTSHLTHFLMWRESIVQWEGIDPHATRVTWTLRYRRGLDPAWYFGPMERYAARLAAHYLIDAVATP
jgi:hypothetical protein